MSDFSPEGGGRADKRRMLKAALADDVVYPVPGVFECIGAKAAEQAGFSLVFVTGNGLSASVLGMPDVGLMTMREVADRSAAIAACVNMPVIADADTGYGPPLNVVRSVREFEQAGLAGVFLEDQADPKRCAYYPGEKRMVSAEEHVAKIRAAVWACAGKDFTVIARTDAFRIRGLAETVNRGRLYAAAGADAIFAVGLPDAATVRQVADALPIPLVVNVNDGDPLALAGLDALKRAGAKLVFYPATVRAAVAKAAATVLACLRRTGSTAGVLDLLASREEFNGLLDLGAYRWLEEHFAVRRAPAGKDKPNVRESAEE